ncbi:MAG TPA: T9SS type A sorting domain-containing protein [Bacteroidota bacterium]|nr:T9SS type A sorting domain-containing protein [Bacteroidota bacterium]
MRNFDARKKVGLGACVLVCLLFFSSAVFSQKKFLFDATKAETAGNADWVIDEDNNVQARYPTPNQSTVTASTPENYWTGALSSWGIALVKLGDSVETLPPGKAISYGDSTNPQDLSSYDVFIVDEPNVPFTATERNAIVQFVKNGGGLFMISDHEGADRNNNGWDAVRVWNDLLRNNSVQSLPFGFLIDSTNYSETTTNILSSSTDPILNGPAGKVTQLQYNNGATMTLNPATNTSVHALIWRSSAQQGSTNVMCASSLFGKGRVVIIGDSSPADDGSGASGNSLYNGWLGPVDHSYLHLNASLWLAKITDVTSVGENSLQPLHFELFQNFPNPFNPSTTIRYTLPARSAVRLRIFNVLGQMVTELVNAEQAPGDQSVVWNANVADGVYFYKIEVTETSAPRQRMIDVRKMVLLK